MASGMRLLVVVLPDIVKLFILAFLTWLKSYSESQLSSKSKKGGEWTGKVNFSQVDMPSTFEQLSENNLVPEIVKNKGVKIRQAWIYKHSMIPYVYPLFGYWHELVIVLDSENFYWSFEKDDLAIHVQRSMKLEMVRDYYRGRPRTATVWLEGRNNNPLTGKTGDTIEKIFLWIGQMKYLKRRYHYTKSNCHYFASLLFEAIQHKKDRMHLGNYENFDREIEDIVECV